jgi:hypothetical protein
VGIEHTILAWSLKNHKRHLSLVNLEMRNAMTKLKTAVCQLSCGGNYQPGSDLKGFGVGE